MPFIGNQPSAIPLTSSDLVDGIVTNPKLSTGSQQNFRNIIINGDMSIAQRGTSVTGVGDGDSGYHTVDRFKFVESGSPSTVFTQSQSTDVPSGQGFAKSLKMDCTATGSGGYLHITQRFEGQNLQYLKKGTSNAESFTLSFWVKSAKTGTYIAEFRDIDNTRNISKSYTISSADTWEKKTITFPGDTSGAFGNDNGSSLELNLWLAAGSSNTSGTLQTNWGSQVAANRAVGQVNLGDSTSNDWYITGMQLEAGTTASEFEFLPADVTEDRCRRYYQIGGNCSGRAYSTGGGEFYYAFEKQMRSAPSATLLDGTSIGEKAGKLHLAGISSYNITALSSASNQTTKSIQFNFAASSLTSGSTMGVLGNPVALDAEL